MADDKRYNGWTNYETWVVNLWIENEQGSYLYWAERTQECWHETGANMPNRFIDSHRDNARIQLASALKDEFENGMADILESTHQTASVWADLLGAALSEVDWDEIADSMIDAAELKDEETEDETV